MSEDEKIELLERRINRERLARKEAERILEEKALELYQTNVELKKLNESLETEIEKRSEALRVSKVRYKQFVELANEIIYETTSDGTITYANPITTSLLQYSNEEIVGKNIFKFIAPADAKMVANHYLKCIEEKKTNSYLEIAVLKKDGEVLWLGQNVTLDFIDTNSETQLVGVRAIARDITDKYYAQIKLELSEEKYRSIMENMELGFLEVDLEGKIVKAYDRFCEMSGYTNAELIGKDPKIIFLPQEYHSFMEEQDASRRVGEISSYEVPFIKKNGEQIWVLISGGPVFNEKGKTVGSVGIHYDISAQKQIQAELTKAKLIAEAAQKSEQQFLANMSHEIRTPLNAIIGMSHLLYDTNPTNEQVEFLEMIKNSANFLHSLISDVLDMAKIEAGRVEINPVEFDLKNLLRTIQKTFQLKTADKDLKVEVSIDKGIDNKLLGDVVLLNQILLNVVGNSEKFTDKGKISISVSKGKKEENKSLFTFKISDTGIGMDEERQKVIFEKFKQIHDVNSTKTKGTGLGLAIVKELVELQQGTIQVKSKKGVGTTFTFAIPYEESKNKMNSKDTNVKPEGEPKFSNLKVLVAEDNLINQKYVSALLKKWEIDFVMAKNGLIAFEETNKSKFDLVFMDIQMPVMDGYESTRKIRNSKNVNAEIPIVALTASAMTDERDKAIDVGMNDLLTKPFTPTQLVDVIIKYASNHLVPTVNQKSKNTPNIFVELDNNVLLATYGGDADFQAIVFQSFLEEIDQQVDALTAAYNAKNWEEVGKVAHQIKPTFGMVGLPDYLEKMKLIEQGIKNNENLPDIERVLNEVFAAIPTIKSTVSAAL